MTGTVKRCVTLQKMILNAGKSDSPIYTEDGGKTVMDENLRNHANAVKTAFEVCNTPEERRTIFFAYTMDRSIPRPAILIAMKELGIQNDMTIRPKTE
jgi:hypothetical protein